MDGAGFKVNLLIGNRLCYGQGLSPSRAARVAVIQRAQ